MMVSHESDINSDRVVPIAAEMEHIYSNFLLGSWRIPEREGYSCCIC